MAYSLYVTTNIEFALIP